jgi:hypothetical protein
VTYILRLAQSRCFSTCRTVLEDLFDKSYHSTSESWCVIHTGARSKDSTAPNRQEGKQCFLNQEHFSAILGQDDQSVFIKEESEMHSSSQREALGMFAFTL